MEKETRVSLNSSPCHRTSKAVNLVDFSNLFPYCISYVYIFISAHMYERVYVCGVSLNEIRVNLSRRFMRKLFNHRRVSVRVCAAVASDKFTRQFFFFLLISALYITQRDSRAERRTPREETEARGRKRKTVSSTKNWLGYIDTHGSGFEQFPILLFQAILNLGLIHIIIKKTFKPPGLSEKRRIADAAG